MPAEILAALAFRLALWAQTWPLAVRSLAILAVVAVAALLLLRQVRLRRRP